MVGTCSHVVQHADDAPMWSVLERVALRTGGSLPASYCVSGSEYVAKTGLGGRHGDHFRMANNKYDRAVREVCEVCIRTI